MIRTLSIAAIVAVSVACGQRLMVANGGPIKSVPAKQVVNKESYPYRSEAFTAFVTDSYKENNAQSLEPFYKWFDDAYVAARPKMGGNLAPTLAEELAARKKELAGIRDPKAKAERERELGAWLHKLIKTTITKFSLDRGFEFTNTVKLCERQCFLQATLISGLAQSMGMDAGVYMVWMNEKGGQSNNGHAVSVIKLTDGRDTLVDASDPHPFMAHEGLFVVDKPAKQYKFVKPRYDSESAITDYFGAGDSSDLKPASVRTLDTAFLKSQFYYYRGERAPGGFMAKPTTKQGLAASARYLELAEQACPQNPLAVYVLGHVYLKEGLKDKARDQYEKGYSLYKAFGYVPDGPREAVGR